MPEIKENLRQQRKPLLSELRAYDMHGKNSWEISHELNRLDAGQLGALRTFVEQGGWKDVLKQDTLRILGESLAARLEATRSKVAQAYAGGEAQSPIAEVSPSQVLSPISSIATQELPPEEASQPEVEFQGAPAVTARQTADSVALATQVPTSRSPMREPTAVSTPRPRRVPLSEPKVAVARDSRRPPEGRGRRVSA